MPVAVEVLLLVQLDHQQSIWRFERKVPAAGTDTNELVSSAAKQVKQRPDTSLRPVA